MGETITALRMPAVEYEWRRVPGFTRYEVTSLGHLRRVSSHIKVSVHLTGVTETVQLTDDNGKRRHRTLTSVVKSAFPGALYP